MSVVLLIPSFGGLIIFLVLLIIGVIVILILATVIHFIIPIIVAVVVWFLTGSLLYAGIAFLAVAIIQLIARRGANLHRTASVPVYGSPDGANAFCPSLSFVNHPMF